MPDHCYSLEPDQRLCQGPYAATASRIGLVDTRLLQQSEYDFSQYDVCLVDKGCVSLLSGCYVSFARALTLERRGVLLLRGLMLRQGPLTLERIGNMLPRSMLP